MIELDDDTSAVVLAILDALQGPMDGEAAALVLRQARFALPRLEQAFADAEIDPDDLAMPDIPLMVPGSKHISP
jgi:hypothetical protein